MDQFVNAVVHLVWHGAGSLFCVPTFVYSATELFPSPYRAALVVFKKQGAEHACHQFTSLSAREYVATPLTSLGVRPFHYLDRPCHLSPPSVL